MSYLGLRSNLSRKRISSPNKTEPSSSMKKYLLKKQYTNAKTPMLFRQGSATQFNVVKTVPSNIIYDKQTLYIQVQQLKKIINKLNNEKMKLNTRISILNAEKDRLHINQQYEKSEEKQLHRAYLFQNQSVIRSENLIEFLKKELKLRQIQLQFQKKEHLRIKRSLKFSKINELQIQLKTIMQENRNLYNLYQSMKSKLKPQFMQSEQLENKIKKLAKQNQEYSLQIQKLNIQIMSLQIQLKNQKARKRNSDFSAENELSTQKRLTGLKLKEIIGFRRENSMIENKIRSFRAKQKLQQTSFKTHHVHVQPIRKINIFGSQLFQKFDHREQSNLSPQKSKTDLINQNVKLKSQLTVKEHKLKQIEERTVKIQNKLFSKPSAVPTFFSENIDQDQNYNQKQRVVQNKQNGFSTAQKKQQVFQLQESDKKQLLASKFEKTDANSKKSQPQKKAGSEMFRSNIDEQKRMAQIFKQTTDLDIQARTKQDQKILNDIKQLLTYRLIYQKYQFSDLQISIQSSNVESFSYVDVCHMLVNEPFYLNLDYCRVLVCFIFDNLPPNQQQMVQTATLLSKLRSIIKDYQQLTIQKQFYLLQRCGKLVKKYKKSLAQQFQSQKDLENTIELSRLGEILKKYEFGTQEIQYMIAEVSINSNDLHHIAYELILGRFSINESQRSSKQEIIFQKGEEENSNIHNSQKLLINQSLNKIGYIQSHDGVVQEREEFINKAKSQELHHNIQKEVVLQAQKAL